MLSMTVSQYECRECEYEGPALLSETENKFAKITTISCSKCKKPIVANRKQTVRMNELGDYVRPKVWKTL